MASNDDGSGSASRFTGDLMYRAATAYYVHDQNQGQVAEALGVSRPTVSRLLSEARRRGIVEIRVHRPDDEDVSSLEQTCAEALGIDRVYVVASSGVGSIGAQMAPGVNRALEAAALEPGDALLISSGRTLYEVGNQTLPSCPDVLVAPTVGGLEEPEPWWQTNEITRLFAERLAGHPVYLYAPALPSPLLSESLKVEPSFRRITHMWETAKAALVGVGAPPLLRSRRAAFFPSDEAALTASVGDVCSRFFDASGKAVSYDGADRVVAISAESLRRIPAAIAVAGGRDKVDSIRAGALGGYFNRLVTDGTTAHRLIAEK